MRSTQEFSRKQKRIPSWDYSSNGYYFVTICTQNHQSYLGNYLKGKIRLSSLGKIVEDIWDKIPMQFPIVELDYHVIMPNHIHGIIIIDHSLVSSDLLNRSIMITRDAMNNGKGGVTGKNNPMLSSHSLSKIIRWFKGRCTYEINKAFPQIVFKWQSSFHDRIIRNEKELYQIRKYINDNPLKWELDKYYLD